MVTGLFYNMLRLGWQINACQYGCARRLWKSLRKYRESTASYRHTFIIHHDVMTFSELSSLCEGHPSVTWTIHYPHHWPFVRGIPVYPLTKSYILYYTFVGPYFISFKPVWSKAYQAKLWTFMIVQKRLITGSSHHKYVNLVGYSILDIGCSNVQCPISKSQLIRALICASGILKCENEWVHKFMILCIIVTMVTYKESFYSFYPIDMDIHGLETMNVCCWIYYFEFSTFFIWIWIWKGQ